MISRIKKFHGTAILTGFLLVVLMLIGAAHKQFSKIPYITGHVSSRSQLAQASGSGATTIFLTSGTTWTVPSDWNDSANTIEVIGGGAGGLNEAGGNGGAGGGGGAYSKVINISLTPAATVGIAVGTGGSAGSGGGDTYFCDSSSNCDDITGSAVQAGAKGGAVGSYGTGNSGLGGSSGSGVGSTKYSGGAGGDSSYNYAGGGGGGAAGPNGVGGAGGSQSGDSQFSFSSGAGGGGSGGGSAGGQSGHNQDAGAGGNNHSGTGAGAGSNPGGGAGSNGGGGGGGAGNNVSDGGTGGAGTEWDASHGSGGGGGGGGAGFNNGMNGGSGGGYGGGGGGAGGDNTNAAVAHAGAGAPGIIAITYTPTGGGGGDSTAPSTPTGLSATAISASAINLSWTASTDNVGVTGYKIFRNASQINTTSGTSYSDTGLTASTQYTYTVAAYDAAGNTSSQSTSASATTQASQQSSNGTCAAHTYYIDYAGGSDSNAGTCTGTAWKRAPGMVGFTGTYSHQAGDHFIFKGGVTWPAAVFQFLISSSGASGNPDYYGVDKTWYTGSSWVRPIFDLARTPISGNSAVSIAGSYVTFDDIEIKNLIVPNDSSGGSGYGFGVASILTDSNSGNRIIENMYIHDWIPSVRNSNSGGDSDFGGIFFQGGNETATGNTIGPGDPPTGESGNSGSCIHSGTYIEDNDLSGCTDMTNGGAVQISGNNFHDSANSFDPGNHANAIYHVESTGQVTYIYNNHIGNLGSTYQTMLLHNGWAGATGTKYYVYNNVYWNVPAAIVLDNADISAPDSETYVYMYNNTCFAPGGICASVGSRPGSGNLTSVVAENNHWISDTFTGNPFCTSATFSGCGTAGTIVDNNITQTPSNAAAEGYAEGDLFAPTSANDVTVGTGTNLSSLCGTLQGLCFDITGTPRRSTGPWDAGTYQYSSLPAPDTTPPSVPSGLAAAPVTSSSVGLNWNASTDNVGLSGYRIYRCTGSSCIPSALLTAGSATSYIDSTVSPSASYAYAVSAYDTSNNESGKSSSVFVTTPASNGGSPGGPSSSSGGGGGVVQTPIAVSSVLVSGTLASGITLSWNTNVSATSQILYGLTQTYGSQTALDSAYVVSHSQKLAGLLRNTLYHLQVRSKDPYGNLASSNDLTIIISPLGAVSMVTPASSSIAVAPASTIPGFITTWLLLDMNNPQVKTLQQILNGSGFLVISSGIGSMGHESTYFGTATEAALKKFQCAKLAVCSGAPYTTGYGATGPMTRSALNSSARNSTVTPATVTSAANLPSSSISTWLLIGTTNSQVMTLQQILNAKGFAVSVSGTGSPGNESTYFGPATDAALKKFQCAKLQVCSGAAYTTGYGATGPKTRAALNLQTQ